MKDIFLLFCLFLIIDLPVILYLNRGMYQSMFDRINQGGSHSPYRQTVSGIMVYLLLAVGLYFVMKSPDATILHAILFGGIVYGIYDFTNLATISAFEVPVAVGDILWGMLLCGLIGFVYKKIKFIEVNK
jgi:uncharacterized membrane protein